MKNKNTWGISICFFFKITVTVEEWDGGKDEPENGETLNALKLNGLDNFCRNSILL